MALFAEGVEQPVLDAFAALSIAPSATIEHAITPTAEEGAAAVAAAGPKRASERECVC